MHTVIVILPGLEIMIGIVAVKFNLEIVQCIYYKTACFIHLQTTPITLTHQDWPQQAVLTS